MGGILFVVVGNSGSGKDSLLAELKQVDGLRLAFPKRWITRSCEDPNETYHPLLLGEFVAKIKTGEFSVWWEAYGYLYGYGREVESLLEAGNHVFLNTSRNVVGELRRRYPNISVITVAADAEAIARRLSGRARLENVQDRQRLERAELFKEFRDWDILIENNGEFGQAFEELLAKVTAKILSKPVKVGIVGG